MPNSRYLPKHYKQRKIETCPDRADGHRFQVPPPNGRNTIGRCMDCGTMREMYNSIESEGAWTKDNNSLVTLNEAG